MKWMKEMSSEQWITIIKYLICYLNLRFCCHNMNYIIKFPSTKILLLKIIPRNSRVINHAANLRSFKEIKLSPNANKNHYCMPLFSKKIFFCRTIILICLVNFRLNLVRQWWDCVCTYMDGNFISFGEMKKNRSCRQWWSILES